MSAIAIFSFENTQVRTLGTAEAPLFIAVDVASALGFKDKTNAIKQHVDLEDLTKREITDSMGRKQIVNCVNESGLYALIFGSKLESAKRFKRWVTSEVLPAIRKQGRYECPIATLTSAQQLQLREAVAKRAKAVSAHYQTIYRALYQRFQVPRYTEILAKDFDMAISFIQTVDLRVPEKVAEKAQEAEQKPQVIASKEFCEHIRTFVYLWKYYYRADLDKLIEVLRAMNSPHAAGIYDLVHDMNLTSIEFDLANVGYPVKELKCYQHWALTHEADAR